MSYSMYKANSQPLSNETLQRLAPAVFATQAHESRSDRYVHIPTLTVVDHLREHGFLPYQVNVAKARDKERDGFQKHLIRFRHETSANITPEVGGGVPELVMINAHDGTCSWRMLAGWFEFLCANGLMIGDRLSEIRVTHKGDMREVVQEVGNGANMMLTNLQQIADNRAQMQAIELSPDEQMIFARAALLTRYDDKDADGKAKVIPIEPDQVLTPRRQAEWGNTIAHPANANRTLRLPKPNLWATFNVVQENIIQGGMYGRYTTKKGPAIRRQRKITGIDQSVAVNRALWTLAEEMGKLKHKLSNPVKTETIALTVA